jgi:predicted ATP-binding protein involved in virulence
MENFRHFEKADVDFVDPGSDAPIAKEALRNVTLLVGVNGAGKTSVLRAVAMSVLAPILNMTGFTSECQIRRGPSANSTARVVGLLRLFRQDVGGSEVAASFEWQNSVTIERKGDYEPIVADSQKRRYLGHPWLANQPHSDPIYKDLSPGLFLLGYGATRRTESQRESQNKTARSGGLRYQRVEGLFCEDVTLTRLVSLVAQLDKGSARFREIKRLLNLTLHKETRFTGKVEQGEAVFVQNGIELPFTALSDGYRAYIGLIADMLYHMNACCPRRWNLTGMTGTVMVDDIDLHLHPEWQRVVVPNLAKAFPKLQFILTSHSPLVAGTLHAENVRIIEDGKIRTSAERLDGLSVDQILRSTYFANTPPRSPAAQARLRKLAEAPAEKGDPSKAIAFLKALAGKDVAKNGSARKG